VENGKSPRGRSVEARRAERNFVFRCTHFDPATRSCDSYASRPGMCRDYPRNLTYSALPEFLPECGYSAVYKKGEQLRSARFVGDRAYLVTFAVYWATVTIYLVLWANVWRLIAEGATLAAAYARPYRTTAFRRTAERAYGLLYYGGALLVLLLRLLP